MLSAFHIIVDEAGLCDFNLFMVSVAPFTASVNGNTTFIGLPNQDSSNLLQRMYDNKNVKNTLYDANLVYEMRKMVDKQFAEDYKKHLDGVIASNGRNSAFVQWNYFLNFTDTNGKFCTEELLEKMNVLTETTNQPINDRDNTNRFLCAGLDISPKKDFRVLTCMVTEIKNGLIYNREFDKETYNKDKCRMEHEDVAEKIARTLKRNKIDMICVDATAQGLYFVQTLRKKIKEIGINTLIVPYSYNGTSKAKLFGFLEDTLYGGQLKMLKRNESWESDKTVQEMCYMIKEKGKKDNDSIKYYAPQGSSEYTDDHMNSLALANICYRHAYEMFRNKEFADDGAKKWKIFLNKFKDLSEVIESPLKLRINSIWEIPL